MRIRNLVLAAALAITPAAAHAQVLTFEGSGLDPNTTFPGNVTFLNGFYDGGTDALGFSGTNYGVTFSGNAQILCYNTLTSTCSNTSRGGLAPGSETGGLNWADGSSTYITIASGFTTGFSLVYSDANGAPAYIEVYDGIDGTGTMLAHLDLVVPTPNGITACPGYHAGFCPFTPLGIAFDGVGKSIVFGGTADQVEFDDITFGSITAGQGPDGAVPEPGTISLMATGLVGMAGAGLRRRRRVR